MQIPRGAVFVIDHEGVCAFGGVLGLLVVDVEEGLRIEAFTGEVAHCVSEKFPVCLNLWIRLSLDYDTLKFNCSVFGCCYRIKIENCQLN